ncbi:histidine phosphatase family protein [Undibacterium sp. CY21W]|uniref:histidine phosphatase family protein n=1 Tax=Undibacterium sp. CY21W TaxID=2762293 RepID=UPI00164C0311|nr:histidine phosphatase family protein [Undibacterium sp. CY21W]MBC3927510.1 histidine phosphatase family protein [Undibacterium sp. CY21W]
MLLHLIRHTRPIIEPGICYGQSDVAVTSSDCMSLAASLKPRWSAHVPVYSSPLQRCTRLADLLHPTPLIDPRIMELNFGHWEMQAWEQISRSEVDAWAADVVHYRPGQQENLVQMAERVSAFLGDLHAAAEPEAVIVCHAGVIKMIAAWENALGSVGIAQRAAQSKDEFSYGCCIDINIVM